MRTLLSAGLALALAAPAGAAEPAGAEIAALRQAIDALRATYEARLQALEQRLRSAEARLPADDATPPKPAHTAATTAATTAASTAASTAAITANATPTNTPSSTPAPMPPPAPAPAPSPAPSPALPAGASPQAGANSFNPAISLILSGLYTHTSRDPAGYGIAGFLLPAGGEAGPGTRGFSLGETELGIAASVDPWWRGAANVSLHGDDTVSVEEAFVQTTALGNGFTLKAGRFFSGIGYLNAQHAHTWDFVDNPLAYQAMLGTQLGDDGVQLTWLAPLDSFVELGVEAGRGRAFPGGDNSRNGAGMTALTAHAGGDIGDSHSWRAGLSWLNAKADDQALTGQGADGNGLLARFSGRTQVWIADAVWKWAPGGNATRTNFKLQGEYVHSLRRGDLAVDPAAIGSPYRAASSGWYVQGIYQFMPRWRVGWRTEQLDAGTVDIGANAAVFAATGLKPRKQSLMLDFSASEFSRLRLQLAQERSLPGAADTQWFVQYQMSLGAHGAHSY